MNELYKTDDAGDIYFGAYDLLRTRWCCVHDMLCGVCDRTSGVHGITCGVFDRRGGVYDGTDATYDGTNGAYDINGGAQYSVVDRFSGTACTYDIVLGACDKTKDICDRVVNCMNHGAHDMINAV